MRKSKNGTYPYNDLPDLKTLRELIAYSRSNGGDRTVFYKGKDNDIPISFRVFGELVESLGTLLIDKGLHSAKIALLGEDSSEWVMAFFAVTNSDNVVVPLDRGLNKEDLLRMIRFTECQALFYSQKSEEYKDYFCANIPDLQCFCIEDVYTLAKEGRKLIDNGDHRFADISIDKDQLASIVFTSGTSGVEKGVMLSHGNLMSDVRAALMHVLPESTHIFLPFHHTFIWCTGFLAVHLGLSDGHISKNLKRLSKDMARFGPQSIAVVPMAADMIYNNIWLAAKKQGQEKKLKAALKISNFLMKLGIDKRRQIFKSVIDGLGGRMETIVCGGAALDPEIQKGLYDFGFNALNGYGITECSPTVAVNRPHDFRFGSVGKPIPCCEVKIDEPDDKGIGEILVAGDNVMLGYYKDEEATREAFDGKWFRTGDYGYLDKDGFLYITGRKKNLIILANGENISPEELEQKLSRIVYVKEVAVYSDKDKIVAEFYLDEENYPDARKTLDDDIMYFNKSMPASKNINKVKVRDVPFEKTTTMKIKRYLLNKEEKEDE